MNRKRLVFLACAIGLGASIAHSQQISPEELAAVKQAEQQRIAAIEKVYGSVVAMYPKTRQGGGSGVVMDDDGFVLTNNHVMQPIGEEGLGGLADGKLYKLTLIGLDPGGDVGLARLHGKPQFTPAPLGNSDNVDVGDFCMAMGNPFVLAQDQRPTVTYGVISGTHRYQSGQGNVGVYGNCLQIDTSINPGNSGGPLFNTSGQVVGINGRGSFEERGRVNVGLGYAISINQIKRFLPDLRASKICMHGTLDATFGDRDGKVVCEQVNLDAEIAQLGLQLSDTLLSIDGVPVHSANQVASLLSTYPAKWPVQVAFEHEKQVKTVWLRLRPLPYVTPARPPRPTLPPRPVPATQRAATGPSATRPVRLPPGTALPTTQPRRTKPGEIRSPQLNQEECQRILRKWKAYATLAKPITLTEKIRIGDKHVATQQVTLTPDGKVAIKLLDGQDTVGAAEGWNAFALSLQGAKDMLLEGGDRTQDQPAYRLRLTDADGKRTLLFFSVFGDDGAFAVRLLKSAGELAGVEQDPMWTFSDYRRVGEIMLPHRRTLVKELAESPQATAVITSCKMADQPQAAGSPIAWPLLLSNAPATQPANPFAKAIAVAQDRSVKIYGAGVAMEHGYASGIIVSNDGLILTADGLILSTSNLRVVLPDGRTVPAVVLRRSEPIQAALLKVDLTISSYFQLTGENPAKKGDWVVAVGNAFKVADGTEPLSVNIGIVSLVHDIDAKRRTQDVPYDGQAMVIDAITSNPGAPGGPVLTADGRLAGMIGRIIESKSTNTRLNYAVPVERLYAFVRGDQPTTKPTLAAAKPVTGIRLFLLGGRKAPAYIDRVADGSPAAGAGLKKDDLVLAINGKPVRDCEDYQQIEPTLRPNTEATFTIKRKTQILQVKLTPTQEAQQ